MSSKTLKAQNPWSQATCLDKTVHGLRFGEEPNAMGSTERKSLIKTISQNYTLAFYHHKRTRLIGYKYPMNLQAPGS
jgi:hypothetical protein